MIACAKHITFEFWCGANDDCAGAEEIGLASSMVVEVGYSSEPQALRAVRKSGWRYNKKTREWRCPYCVKKAEEEKGQRPLLCRECGAPSDNGEGWDGLCGNCADRREKNEQA